MAASIGFQFDAQTKIIILVFTQKNALDKFQNSDGWKVGVDRSVALVTLDASENLLCGVATLGQVFSFP